MFDENVDIAHKDSVERIIFLKCVCNCYVYISMLCLCVWIAFVGLTSVCVPDVIYVRRN